MKLLPWKCPKCGAPAAQHGKGGKSACIGGWDSGCDGLLCGCDFDSDLEDKEHGCTYAAPCENATCYHCGWAGTMPPFDAKKLVGWAATAWKEGWRPPVGWKPSKLRGGAP